MIRLWETATGNERLVISGQTVLQAAEALAFGSATSCRVLAGNKSRATWSSIGLTIQFIAARGICQRSSGAQLQVLTATGPRWRTSKGLAVGDPLSKLERLYPTTKAQANSYSLAKLGRSGSHATLSATVRGARVTGLSLAVRSGS